MSVPSSAADRERAHEFYRDVLARLQAERIPFLVGGAYALAHYAGVVRDTKDLDVFVEPAASDRVLAVLAAAGFETEVTSPIWLGKARCGEDFVDVIFSSGNAMAEVDGEWFVHAEDAELLGVPVKMVPVEEMIWSKAYVMERERYDGADVAHLLLARGARIDWRRLLGRFGAHWRVLLSHLVLFGFVYPCDRDAVPRWMMDELAGRLQDEVDAGPPPARVCQGTLLSRTQYRTDLEEWSYRDGRVLPHGRMTRREARAMDRDD